MKKSKIYTRTGDAGQTALVSGKRISKGDLRIDLYGEVDELNSRVGLARSYMGAEFSKEIAVLNIIQSALFDLGSNLACEEENREKYKLPQLTSGLVQDIEQEIDRLDEVLSPLKNFILPGGHPAAASMHLCRTCARSVERKMVHFQEQSREDLPENALVFMNRLSDYFFVLSRHINRANDIEEVVWEARN